MFAITQVMDVGDNFDGVLPTTDPVTTDGVKVYPKDTVNSHGGLFEFTGSEKRAVEVMGFQFKGAGQSTWTLNIVDPVAGDMAWLTGTSSVVYVLLAANRVTLLPGQKLKLVTTGTPTTTELRATVMFAPAALGET